MPLLDVSFVTRDPMLSDAITVTRRMEIMGNDGRVTTSNTVASATGVVTQMEGTLERRDDAEFVPRKIQIATAYPLREATQGYKPDIVTWNGTDYVVIAVYPYNRFGSGLWRAELESFTNIDAPQ